MSSLLRFLYLICGIAGLVLLVYRVIETFPDINPMDVLVITVPDMLFFFLAYKTYPAQEPVRRYRY
jgi:hypothetical protein